MALIVLLILSQDAAFAEQAHARVMLPRVDWFLERPLRNVSLGRCVCEQAHAMVMLPRVDWFSERVFRSVSLGRCVEVNTPMQG